MTGLARLLRRAISPRNIFMRLADATNAALGRRSRGRLYFENVYRDSDPWKYQTNPYEIAKYQKTLEFLPQARFARALEVGCSIGIFTEMLAGRAEEVVGIDISSRACRTARERCRSLANVRIERSDLVHFIDGTQFDLIVAAEVLYFLWEVNEERLATCRRIGELLRPGGWLVMVFGGDGAVQDWESELEKHAGLTRRDMLIFEDPVRPWRLSLLQRPAHQM